MKYKLLYAVAVMLVLIACGSDQSADATQVGIALQDVTPMHGHSGMTDGGILRVQHVRAFVNSGYVISGATTTSIRFNGESIDSLNSHSISSNTDRITVPANYSYAMVQCSLAVRNTVTLGNSDYIQLRVNGSAIYGITLIPYAPAFYDATVTTPAIMINVSAADVIKCELVSAVAGSNYTISGSVNGEFGLFSATFYR